MRKTQRKINMYSELLHCYGLSENKADGEKMQDLILRRFEDDGISVLEVLSAAETVGGERAAL